MAKRNSFFVQLAKAQRANEKIAKARQREREKEARELERTRKEFQRSQEQIEKARQRALLEQEKTSKETQKAREKAAIETEKERARLYTESRIAEVNFQNAELEETIAQLECLLEETLSVDDYLDLETLKEKPELPVFVLPSELKSDDQKPQLERYLLPELSGLQRLIPGARQKHTEETAKATASFEQDLKKYTLAKEQAIDTVRRRHQAQIAKIKEDTEAKNAEIDQFKAELSSGKPDAIVKYCSLVLLSSVYPDDFPQHSKIAYVPESKQLVVEYDLPTMAVVPEVSTYKYAKTKDEVTATNRPATQRKALYASIIAQITLRTIHELFEAERLGHLETIVFNGFVESVDKGTGRDVRTCLVTLRTTRETFMEIDLSRVEPDACLKTLNASVSKSPAELAPVRPILEFNMVDPRFIEEADIISTLDQRTNLMDLTPGEFESLITNLFQKMGLEAKQTQASRDGGVDCVAFDPRPIFGGKVVIQAKRYKHTVGVSAVRDLYGTLQNEGASKGILVTTSGYGKAAFEFAEGKPIELISGSNLLYLLAEHAGIEAKIQPPEDWKDSVPDSV